MSQYAAPRPQYGGLRPLSAMPRPQRECVVCAENYDETEGKLLECRHFYCHDCLGDNVKVALANSPFIPAKCCTVVPLEMLRDAGAFEGDEEVRYREKMFELTNPGTHLYCCFPDCGRLIMPADITTRVGRCRACLRSTCRKCHQQSHWNTCDPAVLTARNQQEDQLLKLAHQQGWKRCPNCTVFVERDGGCNDMECHCGQLFCYRCGYALDGGGHPHVCR
ncbi:hypothetical protein F4780DRAFT_778752 [Xylariomycetidae sp. FL0641]|nr:hypothetical protein F4780DRAFT_778752 [Xylariomycetidae sp. FL0641]